MDSGLKDPPIPAGNDMDGGGFASAGGGVAVGPGSLNRRNSMRRRLSRRNLSKRNLRNSAVGANNNDLAAAAAIAAAEDEGFGGTASSTSGGGGGGGGGNPTGKMERQDSWYADVLMQGGAEGLGGILGDAMPPLGALPAAATASSSGAPVADDDEVLEQYRIMAHVEANIRVKENTGFDLAEYEKRRKLQEPANAPQGSGRKKPKAKLPGQKKLTGLHSNLHLEEPKLPPRRVNRRYIEQWNGSKAPELCIGEVVQSGNASCRPGEHIVRCLGCRTQLRVSWLATLVKCPLPDCLTVSPASSTRR